MLASCEKQNVILNVEDALIGKWSSVIYEDGLQIFKRVKSFDESYGLAFESNTDMFEWTSGWCGTPPLHFFKLENTYTLIDSILEYEASWYKVVKCDEDELVLEIVR